MAHTNKNVLHTVICQNLVKSFGDQIVVDDLSAAVAPGEILTLLGPSGCGKTTTLRLIAGLETLDQGEITIAGQVVNSGRKHVPTEKRRIGMVFQDYAIFPHLSVGKNVAFGLPRGKGQAERVAEFLKIVGLAGMGERMPHELSGGQQQRVALARALAPSPAVLLMDEPFSNLDAALRVQMREEVRQLLVDAGITAIFVTHDQEEALFMGDRVAVMHHGRIEQLATPEEIFHRPQTRFVAEFIGQTDFLPGTVTADGVETPLGTLGQRVSAPLGTPVEIALRADDIVLEADGGGNGRILGRQFVGIAYIYRVALPDGSVVRSWRPHHHKLAAGERVRVAFGENVHQLSCFVGGKAV